MLLSSDRESSLKLEDILVFVTGADKISVGGFDDSSYITCMDEVKGPFPMAHTCWYELCLPVVQDTCDCFKKSVEFCIVNAQCFGFA